MREALSLEVKARDDYEKAFAMTREIPDAFLAPLFSWANSPLRWFDSELVTNEKTASQATLRRGEKGEEDK